MKYTPIVIEVTPAGHHVHAPREGNEQTADNRRRANARRAGPHAWKPNRWHAFHLREREEARRARQIEEGKLRL